MDKITHQVRAERWAKIMNGCLSATDINAQKAVGNLESFPAGITEYLYPIM